jgi:hypothetical protein
LRLPLNIIYFYNATVASSNNQKLMKSTKLVLLAFSILFFLPVFSQPICGTDRLHEQLMKDDPVYRKNRLLQEENVKQYLEAHKNQIGQKVQATVTIPVVVHVIHTGGAIGTIYNPTDAQILGAIDYLNQVFNGTLPGLAGVGDMEIQFAMAQRDPNCNPTNGINRVNGSGVTNYTALGMRSFGAGTAADEATVKNLSRWSNTQYYNIWIVNKIDGADGTAGQFIAGFAYFPGASATVDGTVMLATQMEFGEKTLPHEIGHAFNLPHPFGNSNDVAVCGDDGVGDTDPCSQNVSGGVNNFTPRTGANSCNGGINFGPNTENNFMSYTSVYTLFTAGQKTRTQAALGVSPRVGLTTSAGATPTFSGTLCTPKINFELADGAATEATASTSGCRAYTDYTYNMTIGSNPSAAATATLAVSGGTATEGVDFDITTNGNFAAPSKALTFPSAAHNNQPFTIRVYNDAIVDGTETFTLNFTVNNGGGNAVLGNGRPVLTVTLSDNDAAPVAGGSTGTVNVGTAAFLNPGSPFDATQASQRAHILYKASELTAAGVPAGSISGIAFNIQKTSTRAFSGFTIKMGTTGLTYLVNSGFTEVSPMTTVKTLGTYNTVNGWNSFTFDTPFSWDGTSNVVVEICYNNGSVAAGDAADNIYLYSDGGTATQGNIMWQNAITCAQAFGSVTYYPNGIKPIARFSYGIPPTPVATTTVSKQEYLGANADIYFYDQTNGQLMARIRNLSAHDYGCTTVQIDRAGTGATAFWNNNTANYLSNKTFRVTPTTNNASGSYEITLFYTQAEVNGWQTATGQSIANAQIIKAASQISNVTPGNPTGGGTINTATATVGTLGTTSTLTASFSNGFSGFGIGVAGTPLPIKLVDFKARLKGDNVALDWSTSSESNSRSFEIERSYDGNKFTKVGTLAAAGNSNTLRSYAFADPEIAQENNYYRLKQIDLDGKSEYSKVVQVKNPQRFGKFKVLTNPFANTIDIEMGKGIIGTIEVRLLDMTGKELYRSLNDGNGQARMRINLSGRNISAGIYLLEVRTNNERYTERVMKQ